MKTFLEYVDEAQKKAGLESDAAFAKHLGAGRNLVSQWKNGGSTPDDYYCIVMAEILGIDPLEIIAAANHARAKDDEKKTWWENFRKQHVKNVVAVLLGLTVLFSGLNATMGVSQVTAAAVISAVLVLRIMYIMSSWKRIMNFWKRIHLSENCLF
ncbi:MAG: hypothetical protein H6R07_2539 [Proteobacteria bacterium]|nr:hypothetical protein [Pseudomonadota bacterium]